MPRLAPYGDPALQHGLPGERGGSAPDGLLTLGEGLGVTPGVLFSPTAKFRICIRVSCGMPWSERIEAAVTTVGRIARRLAAGGVH